MIYLRAYSLNLQFVEVVILIILWLVLTLFFEI